MEERFKYNKNSHPKRGRILSTSGPRDLQRKKDVVDQSSIVSTLREEIKELKSSLGHRLTDGDLEYTKEDLEREIRKSHASIEAKYQGEITLLKKEKESLENHLKKEQTTSVKAFEERDRKFKKIDAERALVVKENLKLKEEINILKNEIELRKTKIDNLELRIAELKELLEKALKNKGTTTTIIREATGEVEDEDRPKLGKVFIDPIDKKSKDGLKLHADVKDVTEVDNKVTKEKVEKLRKLVPSLSKNKD